jgi:antitoxin component YwqK of YwqJK toxin-antitoxin module
LYVNQEKDSVWTYYSGFDGSVRMTENYREGSLHGIVSRYYPEGTVSESVRWEKNKRQGPWLQFYQNGNPRLEGYYEDDELHGPYKVWSPDSLLRISGQYTRNQTEGIWTYYDDDGNQLYDLEYRNGLPLDHEKHKLLLQDPLLRVDTATFDNPFL